jgi:peptidoglycan hydrolase CwlO-like protein
LESQVKELQQRCDHTQKTLQEYEVEIRTFEEELHGKNEALEEEKRKSK